MAKYVIICLASVFINSVTSAVYTGPVDIEQGSVVGVKESDDYNSYYGIPYAGAPTGENRFKAPIPPPKFNSTFYATNSSIICAQPGLAGAIGTEDCLVLNVHTKKNETALSPVMVWIHGGEFKTGSASGPSFKDLVGEGVTVVSVNYRLSVFGFLCLRTEAVPGNAGLKDVIAALRWIKKNIRAFGGNPDKVTIFGHGAGAAIVDILTITDKSENLFHAAIAQSGTAIAPWAVSFQPIESAMAFGAKLGYNGKSVDELVRTINNTNSSKLVTVLNQFDTFTDSSLLFAPCLEHPEIDQSNNILTEAPLTAIQSKRYSQVPYLTGFTNNEGTKRAKEITNLQWLDKMQKYPANFLPVDLRITDKAKKEEILKSISKQYFGEKTTIEVEDFLDFEGDTMFVIPIIRNAYERALVSKSPVYIYQFAYLGGAGSEWPYPKIPLKGARHGEELFYLLNYESQPTNPGVFDNEVRSSLVRRWTSFAKTFEPTAKNTEFDKRGTLHWKKIETNPAQVNCLLFGPTPQQKQTGSAYGENIIVSPHEQWVRFWEPIYEQYIELPRASSVRLSALSAAISLCLAFVWFSRTM